MSNFPGYALIAIGIVFVVLIIGIFNPINSLNIIDFYTDDTHIAQRSGINLISGDLITVTGTDDPANSRVNYNIGSASESGVASVATSTSSVVLSHSLGSVSNVLITALDNPKTNFWVSATSTVNIVISLQQTQTSTKRFFFKIYK